MDVSNIILMQLIVCIEPKQENKVHAGKNCILKKKILNVFNYKMELTKFKKENTLYIMLLQPI